MKKTSLIGHTLEVLELFRSQSRPADSVLAEFFRSRHYLGSRDRRFVAEAYYGILRNYLLLESSVREARDRARSENHNSPVSPLELYISYAHLVLHEELQTIINEVTSLVSATGHGPALSGLLDALGGIALPNPGADPVRQLSISHSIPEAIVREWFDRFGVVETEHLCMVSNISAPTTIRVNTLRCSVDECQSMLGKEGVGTTRTSLSPVGLVLEKRMNVQSLSAFREGAFEIQDEGSQILSFLLEPSPGSRVVDACAGAGGKTLHLAALMGNKGSILAIDTEPRRLEGLQERAVRAGATMIQARVAGDPLIAEWKECADAVFVDAPCTGVGTFRRNPGSKMTFTWQSVDAAAERQTVILNEYAQLVKPGGRLVYATCSLLSEENEEVADRFLRDHPFFHAISAPEILARQEIALSSPTSYLTLLPHKTGTDGFFGAVLQRE
jgi:16S rRNA (cytosine967-C5)-methyltransferase